MTPPRSGIEISRGRYGGVRVTAIGASVDTLYRAHLAAYGLRDEATKDARAFVANRQPFEAEASPEEWLSLAHVLYDFGLRSVARKLFWEEAWERAEELHEQAADLENEADRLLAGTMR